jgi:hypothetical protein
VPTYYVSEHIGRGLTPSPRNRSRRPLRDHLRWGPGAGRPGRARQSQLADYTLPNEMTDFVWTTGDLT